ncbi:membrane protein of unknown function [Thermococcus nautili]|uniref:hypothetical protein n=1 Tax=Thermococcus nautili TaxID=195522 RepID=UPI002556C3A1|nr:hypothetical protein [Thermococcus nautili]CAI1492699.1 membrane protein of unknown function [Thermococcus nautili]
MLPVLGFYPFIYAIKSPFSWILASLVILIPVLSLRYLGFGDDSTEFIVFALPVLVCLGMPDRDLSAVGMILVSLAFYVLRKRLELQYIVSYGILWVLVNSTHKIEPPVFGMGIIFGLAVLVIVHYILRRAHGENFSVTAEPQWGVRGNECVFKRLALDFPASYF